MHWQDALLRFRALFRRREMDAALDEELQFHLEMQARKNQARELDSAEAKRQARLQFGSVERAMEECREARGLGAVERAVQDVRFAVRLWRKSPATTAVLVLTLALGIGANTAVFTLINGLLLRSLPVDHPEQIFFFGFDPVSGHTFTGIAPTGDVNLFSYRFFEQFRNGNNPGFYGLTAMATYQDSVTVQRPDSGEPPHRFTASMVDGEFFHLLGVNAVLGRVLVPGDDLVDKPTQVVVVSYRYWLQEMGRDANVIGKTLLVNGAPFTIVGVAPPEFYGVKLNYPTDLWFALNQQSFLMSRPNWLKIDNAYWLDIIGRLKPGANPRATEAALTGQLQQMLTAVEGSHVSPERAQRIRESHIELVSGVHGISLLRQRFSPRLHVLAVLVMLVFSLACLNAANLLFARGIARRREIAVRLALGAGRTRVIRQLLTESALLAVLSGVAGFVLAAWAIKTFSVMALGASARSPLFSFVPDLRVLGFTFVVSLVTGILFGIAPALRSTKIDLNEVLKDEFRSGTTGSGLSRLTPAKLLVSTQVVISLALLMTAGLFIRSLQKLEEQDLGFVPDQVLACHLDLGAAGYKKTQLPQLYSRLIDRVVALPGVRSAALTSAGMLSGSSHTSNISIEGYTAKPGESMIIQHRHVTWNYLQTNGISLVEGRDISQDDKQNTPHVAVINEAFAQRYLPNQDPIGHRFNLGGEFVAPGMQIVGVVKNSKYSSLDENTQPMAFIPLLQEPFKANPDEYGDRPYTYGNELDVRATGDPAPTSKAVLRAIAEIDRTIPIGSITTLTQRVSDSTRDAKAVAQLSGIFGLLALLLASIGIYGVIAHNVSRRTHEIGVRMAVGAQARDVLHMVLRESLLVVMIGVIVGIPAAFGMGHVIASQLFGLSSRDSVTMMASTLLILSASLIASYLPARRAARTDPMIALRHE